MIFGYTADDIVAFSCAVTGASYPYGRSLHIQHRGDDIQTSAETNRCTEYEGPSKRVARTCPMDIFLCGMFRCQAVIVTYIGFRLQFSSPSDLQSQPH